MSAADAEALDQAIATTVAELVAAAARPGATTTAWQFARDAAQILALDGLDRALAAGSAHAGTVFPADVAALVDRLGRLAETVRAARDVAPFRDANAELNALADELRGYEWEGRRDEESDSRAAVAALRVAEVLDDVPLAGEESSAVARRSRLPVPVAAAIRAAIDWLTRPGAGDAVRLFGEPSLLELRFERIRTDRLYAVHRVIAAAGGNIGPASQGPGWVVRVPSYAARPTYLMLVQGGVRIAVPWHAVLKLRIASNQPGRGQWPADHVVLPTIAPAGPEPAEHPVVLMGHGLKRGYLVADRFIWRMTADPCENEWGTPGGGLRDTVRTEDGEVFWVADPARLFADVALPEIAIEPASVAPVPRTLGASDVTPLENPAPEAPAPVASAPPAVTGAPSATAPPASIAPVAVARPVPAPVAPIAPDSAPVAPRPSPPTTAVAPIAGVATARPRALVADDSLTMRLLLARLLEKQGFAVETAASAAELTRWLAAGEWSVLFTDLELPDGGGPDWLRRLCRLAASHPRSVHVVGLVRDGGDLDVARAAGVEDTLLKPFVHEALNALLARRGWGRA